MHLVQIEGDLERPWDEFASTHAANITNLTGWRKVLKDSYGIRSHFIGAMEASDFVGGLCLYEFKHPLFGHYLTTAAFATDGGLIGLNSEVEENLLAAAVALANEKGVDYLLVRGRSEPVPGWQNDAHYQTAMIDLRVGSEALWKTTLPGKTRNQARRGMKEGFQIESGADQAGDFYNVFHEHMRNLGSPAHSKRYYENIRKHLGDYVRFLVAKDQGQVVSGAMLIELNGTAMNLHTVSLSRYNRRCPNYLLYWEMIRGSCERGNDWFDMGRSEAGSNNMRFKTNWGSQAVDLNYDYYLRKSGEIPYVDPRNPRYKFAVASWKKLPLFVSKTLGPWLIRGLG